MSTPVHFSVIVPVYQQWALVPRLVGALSAQTLTKHLFEVILVDNGSDHFSPPKRLPPYFRILRCLTPGSYAARNAGAAQARAPWLAFTDADCLPKPDWLAAYVMEAARHQTEDVILAGKVEMRAPPEAPNRYETYELLKGIPQSIYVSKGYAATANLAVSRGLFERLTGFDEKRLSGGDADFCRRAVRAGAKLHYVRGACVSHAVRASRTDLILKARRIKGGQVGAGSGARRFGWFLRTFAPPVHLFFRYMRHHRYPLSDRLAAIRVQAELWLVEMFEAIRVYVFRGSCERR